MVKVWLIILEFYSIERYVQHDWKMILITLHLIPPEFSSISSRLSPIHIILSLYHGCYLVCFEFEKEILHEAVFTGMFSFDACHDKHITTIFYEQFAWTHVTLLIVVTQSYLIIQNMFEGLIWFVVPVSMIVANDCMAYIFGFFFGRTPLIKLSPKKTWEGFVGGGISTVIIGCVVCILEKSRVIY